MPSQSHMQQLSDDIVHAAAQWLVQLERMQEQRKQAGQFELSVLQAGIYDMLHIVYNQPHLELHSWISDFSNGEYACDTIALPDVLDEASARIHLFPLLIPALRAWLAPHFASPLLDYRFRISMTVNDGVFFEVDEIVDPVKQSKLQQQLQHYIDAHIIHGQHATDPTDSFFLARHLMDAGLYPQLDADYILHIYKEVLARNADDPENLAQHRSHFIRAFRDWVEQSVLPLAFDVESSWGSVAYKRKPDSDISLLSPAMLQLTRQTAVLIIRHDPSYNKQIGLDLLHRLHELGDQQSGRMLAEGSGQWPLSDMRYADERVHVQANDLSGVVTIQIREESAKGYESALLFLIGLLQRDILRSYTIHLNSKAKHFLSTPGLAKSQTHRFFANALQYEALYPLLAQYARLAMTRHEWYTDVAGTKNVRPGTYAVFGLGLADPVFFPLVRDYMAVVDQEHQSVQAQYAGCFIETHGINASSIATIVACLLRCQDGKFTKYRALFEAPTAITALAGCATTLSHSEVGHLLTLIWGSKKTFAKRAASEQGSASSAFSTLLATGFATR